MNTETGEIYEGLEILRAIQRGEPIVSVSPKVAKAVTLGLQEMSYEDAKKYHRIRNRRGNKK